MLIIIVCVIGAFIYGCVEYDFFEGVLNAILGFLVGCLVYLAIGGILGHGLPQEEVVTEQKIYALNDSLDIYGRRYIFSGYIDEELVYRYVTSNDKGKYIEELDSDTEVYIKEGNYTPVLERHYYTLEKKWHMLFAHAGLDEYYIFYVPENTVTNEYNVDLN